MTEMMHNVFAFGMPGGWEWIVILVVAVLIFGKRLPDIARGMGKSLTEFKKGIKEAQNEVEDAANTDDIVSPESQSDEDILRAGDDTQNTD